MAVHHSAIYARPRNRRTLKFFKRINDFMSNIVPRTRYFDMVLLKALCAVQPRTVEGINDLFWVDSITPTPDAPFSDTARSSKFLVQLTDEEYQRSYRAAKKSASRSFTLMSKAEWTGFIMHKVPALTSVMTQVTRWLIQSPKRQGESRGSMPYKLEDVLTAQYFTIKGFSNDAASKLIALVSELSWEDWEHFSVKLNPKLDQYPTVAIQNPTTSKVTEGTIDKYMTRFKSNMAWNTLAREVARYTGYQLVEPFMRPFNSPEYSVSKVHMQGDIFTYTSQAFVMEDTGIAENIVRGAFSLRPSKENRKPEFHTHEQKQRAESLLPWEEGQRAGNSGSGPSFAGRWTTQL